jgi:hypothetical protein
MDIGFDPLILPLVDPPLDYFLSTEAQPIPIGLALRDWADLWLTHGFLPSLRIFYKQIYQGAFPDPRNIPSNGNTPKAQKARKIV